MSNTQPNPPTASGTFGQIDPAKQAEIDHVRQILADLEAAAGVVKSVPAAEPDPELATEIVSRLAPPARDPDHGDTSDGSQTGPPTHYYLTCTTEAGQFRTVPCSLEVWTWSQQTQPWYDSHADWILNKDSARKVVAVVRKPHLRQGPLAARFNASPDDMVIQKSGNVWEPVTLPHRFTASVLAEALSAMNQAGNVKPGNAVGRFRVKQLVADEAITVAVLDIIDTQ